MHHNHSVVVQPQQRKQFSQHSPLIQLLLKAGQTFTEPTIIESVAAPSRTNLSTEKHISTPMSDSYVIFVNMQNRFCYSSQLSWEYRILRQKHGRQNVDSAAVFCCTALSDLWIQIMDLVSHCLILELCRLKRVGSLLQLLCYIFSRIYFLRFKLCG